MVDVADLVKIEVGPSKTFRSYVKNLVGAILNKTVVIDFDSLNIDKPTARKIYQRAYPRAKV